MVRSGQLSAGHARAVLAVDDPESVAKRILAEGLTVRDVESLSADRQQKASNKKPLEVKSVALKDADTRALEKVLTDVLGMLVEVNHAGEKGAVIIRYSSLEQLDALCHRLKS